MSTPVAILRTGLVTSVGLTAPAACAAIRAGLTNPIETRFVDSSGKRIIAHEVPLERAWRGRSRLVKMAAMAIEECLSGIDREDWRKIPLLLCLSEHDRPGRLGNLDDEMFGEIQHELSVEFAQGSGVIPRGRVAASLALMHARRMVTQERVPLVLITATDSLLTGATLRFYAREQRLLTAENSNGFLPGEGAGALLIGPTGSSPRLSCVGLGFAAERATIDSDEPLRGDGLTQAIKAALDEAGCSIQDLDFRVTDLSGEQYYFKEATLAVSRILRTHKEEFDIWHPAECVGELGAVAGLTAFAVADAATKKSYAPGPGILCHMACDSGQRAAAVLRFGAFA